MQSSVYMEVSIYAQDIRNEYVGELGLDVRMGTGVAYSNRGPGTSLGKLVTEPILTQNIDAGN